MKLSKLKQVVCFVVLFAVITCSLPVTRAEAAYKVNFDVKSQAVYMVNTDTGSVVYAKNEKQRIYPASLTKIMTAIITLEKMQSVADANGQSLKEALENTKVTAPAYLYDEFVGQNVSTADIRQNEEVRVIDLLYALILPSACEAGSILADYFGEGEILNFVDMMNAKAIELGAKDTNFTNAHGLFSEEQVSTAYDLYLITKYALTFPIFEEVCNTANYQMPATNKHAEPYYISHTNYMLSKVRGGSLYYEGMKGVKTGSLPEVGKNLISTASKNGYNYILVTLGAPTEDAEGKAYSQNQAFVDAKNLYDWAFSSFTLQTVMREGDVLAEAGVSLSSDQDHVMLVAKEDVTALLPVDTDPSAIQQNKTLLKDVKAPVKKGDILGQVELRLADDVIATVDMVAMTDVNRSVWLYALDVAGRFFDQTIVKVLLALLLLIIFLYIVVLIRYKQRKRRRAQRMRQNRSQ